MSKEHFVSMVSCLGFVYSGNANFVTRLYQCIIRDDLAMNSSFSIMRKIKIYSKFFRKKTLFGTVKTVPALCRIHLKHTVF